MFVRLFRDSFETPWGFRLQGGKDIGHALTVQRVFSNSPAEGELQRGDVILSINGRDANTFTHKQALDTIKFGGGQIELKVNRPAPGSISLKTLQPTSPTRAPQISPTKTSPNVLIDLLKFPVRRASDQGPRDMPPPAVAGFQPKKITLNKYGGGTTNFGSNYGARAQQPGWRPQSSPYSEQYTPQPSMQEQYGSNYQQYQPQQYQPPSPQYQPPSPQYQPPSPQYQAPSPQYQPQSPQPEPYLPKYQSPGLSQPDYVRSEDPVEEEEYDYVPVSQRKQQFAEKKGAPAAIKSRKAKPFVPASGGGQSFGTDYSKSRPQPPVQQQRPRPPPVAQKPVNAAPVAVDHPDTSSSATVWSGTLRSSGGPRPWEQENVGEYIMPSQRETLQQSPPGRPAPPVSPKPTRPQPQPQPKPSQAPSSPQKQIIVRTSSTVSKPKTPQPGIAHAGRYDCPNVVYSKEMIDPNPRTHSLATDFSHQGGMYPSPIVDQPSGHYVPHYQMQMYPYEVGNIEYKPTYRPVKPPVPSFVAKDAPPLQTVENETNKKSEVETNEIPQIGQDVEKKTKTENVSDHKTEDSVSNSSKDAAPKEPAEPQDEDSSLKDEKDVPDDTKNNEDKVPEQSDEKQANDKPTDSKASTESGTNESSKTCGEKEKNAISTQNVVSEDTEESQVHEKPADENEKAESTKEDMPGDNNLSSEKNPECQGNETSVSSEGGAKEEHVAEPSSTDDAKKDAVHENEISISDTKETPPPENDTPMPNKTEETKEKSSMDNPDDSASSETKDQGTEETTKPETTAENVSENVSEKDNTTDTSPQTPQTEETETKEKERDLPHTTDGENKKEEVVEKPVSEDQKATSENEPTADDSST